MTKTPLILPLILALGGCLEAPDLDFAPICGAEGELCTVSDFSVGADLGPQDVGALDGDLDAAPDGELPDGALADADLTDADLTDTGLDLDEGPAADLGGDLGPTPDQGRPPPLLDSDGDGVPDVQDVCPEIFDPYQVDQDGDGLGEACDPCPRAPNPVAEVDTDDDGVWDACDNCPESANPGQVDGDEDGIGDACDDVTPVFWVMADWPDPAVRYEVHVIREPSLPFSGNDCWRLNSPLDWCAPGAWLDEPRANRSQVRVNAPDPVRYAVGVGPAVGSFGVDSPGEVRLSMVCRGDRVSFGGRRLQALGPNTHEFWLLFLVDPMDCSVQVVNQVARVECEGDTCGPVIGGDGGEVDAGAGGG